MWFSFFLAGVFVRREPREGLVTLGGHILSTYQAVQSSHELMLLIVGCVLWFSCSSKETEALGVTNPMGFPQPPGQGVVLCHLSPDHGCYRDVHGEKPRGWFWLGEFWWEHHE